jgi:conjugative relaxase-like TrwC/TraI family protein
MFGVTKLSQATAKSYFESEYANSSAAYFSEAGKVNGYWQGRIASEMGLSAVVKEEYERSMDGQHPITGEQLVTPRDTYLTREGKEIDHRPGWDLTLSAPKSFSLAALVGRDERMIQALREANAETLAAMERYVQGRGGGNHHHINAERWLVATFEHDTSRPIDGRPDPQWHAHNALVNYTWGEDGKPRAIDPRELYKAQTLGTAVFHWKLAAKARDLGYEIQMVEGHPEIKGFSPEYLAETSRRSGQIQEKLATLGLSGARAAQIVALAEREDKIKLTPQEFRDLMQGLDEAYGNQAEHVVSEAKQRGKTFAPREMDADEAVEWAKHRMAERTSVFEHFEVLRDAIRHGQGTVSVEQAERSIDRQVDRGDLVKRHHIREHAPGARYATKEEIARERDVLRVEVLGRVASGQNSVEPVLKKADLSRYEQLADNPKRQAVLKGILETRDQIVALQGGAGTAKTNSTTILAEIMKREGWVVKGLAPTGKSVDALRERGIDADTVQMHNKTAIRQPPTAQKTFYILDEASLVSTKQMHRFLATVKPQDHALLIGDDDPKRKVGQHTSVEAGRIFSEMQEAGMKTAYLNKIYRQKDEPLKQVVLQLRNGHTETALSMLHDQGRIHEVPKRTDRFVAIAKTYAEQPEGTLVVSPDNKSRQELNDAIRNAMQSAGHLQQKEYLLPILVPRDLTAADHARAWSYRVGDTVQYIRGDANMNLPRRSYATVLDSQSDSAKRINQVTVKAEDGRILTYDPSTVKGVSTYESRLQHFAEGERVQFTSRWKDKGLSTRDTGTIQKLDDHGNATVSLDRGRKVKFNLWQHRHVDYAYTLTSHSAQSATVDRCLVHVDTNNTKLRGLHNASFGYVAMSRPQFDLQLFCDDKDGLVRELSRPLEKHKALSPAEIKEFRTPSVAMEI